MNQAVITASDPLDKSPANLQKRVWLSCVTGSLITWYDFMIFNIATAMVFAPLFFTDMTYLIPMLVFAVGFLSRPLGSVIFGYLGDRFGRRNTLVWTLLLTGCSTVAIGLLPTYEQIGAAAGIALFVLRVLQTAAVGGEWAAASSMMHEYNQVSKNRGFLASLLSNGLFVSLWLAGSLFAFLTSFGNEAFLSWGWRVPFLISALLIVVGVYTRLRVLESQDFRDYIDGLDQRRPAPLRDLTVNHWRTIIPAALLSVPSSAWNYGIFVFGVGYIIKEGLGTRPDITATQATMWFVAIWAMFLWGWLSDRVEPLKMWIVALLGGIVFAYPMISALSQGDIVVPMLIALLTSNLAFALSPAFYPKLFPVSVRQSGAGITYNLGLLIGGGITPVALTWVTSIRGNIFDAVWVFIAIGIIGLVSAIHLLRQQNLEQSG